MPSVAAYALGLVGANTTVSLIVTPPLGATPQADPDSAVYALAPAPWTRKDRVAGADPGLAPFATVTGCDSVVPVETCPNLNGPELEKESWSPSGVSPSVTTCAGSNGTSVVIVT